MAGYQGGADQTVIAAAKSAAAVPKGYHASVWDYKEFVEGVANVAKFVVGKVDAANERASGIAGFEEGINKEFWSANNTEYFTDLKGQMSEASKTMSMSLPFTKAYKDAERIWSNGKASLDKLKGDEEKLEEVIKRVKECSGPNQSGFNNPMLKSLMEEINGGSGMFDQSVRFTDDGIVVMGPNGEEIFIDDLPNISSKVDGKATHDLVNTQITGAVDLKSKGNWSDRNKYLVRQNISGHLDAQTSGIIGSAAFDYEHLTADGPMSFADHLMATSGPYNEAFNEWKNTGGIGASQAEIKETKMMMAQELWDDNQSMKDEYLDFVMDNVLDFQVGGQKVKSTSKNNKNKGSGSGSGSDNPDIRNGGDGDGDGGGTGSTNPFDSESAPSDFKNAVADDEITVGTWFEENLKDIPGIEFEDTGGWDEFKITIGDKTETFRADAWGDDQVRADKIWKWMRENWKAPTTDEVINKTLTTDEGIDLEKL